MKNTIKHTLAIIIAFFMVAFCNSCVDTSEIGGFEKLKLYLGETESEVIEEKTVISYVTYGFFKDINANEIAGEHYLIETPLTMQVDHYSSDEITISDWNSSTVITATYETRDIKTHPANNEGVAIVDSEFILKLWVDGKSHDVIYHFQKAKYSSGLATCYLPHYEFSNPMIGIPNIIDLEPEDIDEVTYARKRYRNIITVTVDEVAYATNVELVILYPD